MPGGALPVILEPIEKLFQVFVKPMLSPGYWLY